VKAGWSRSDFEPNTHHFLPMRYGVSMLQVVRVHLEPVKGPTQLILVCNLDDHFNFYTALAG
jgi:hypothetical protein